MALVDTAGAYPGIDAEERGQAEAIARSTEACLELGVPNVAVIIGEGGSGGAIAIATANRVLMLEHAIYSVISPEGAASILWRDTAKAQDAATNMKITAQDLIALRHHRRASCPSRPAAPIATRRPRSPRPARRSRRRSTELAGPRPRDRAPAAAREVPRDRHAGSNRRPAGIRPNRAISSITQPALNLTASAIILPFVHCSRAQSAMALRVAEHGS